MRNRHLYILAATLSLVGLCIFLYKVFVLELPLRPEARTLNWEVEARLSFIARGGPVKLSFFLPSNEGSLVVIDQSFVSEGYGLTTVTEGVNRRAIFSVRQASGEQTIYCRFVVHQSSTSRRPSARRPSSGSPRSSCRNSPNRTCRPRAAWCAT
ncbi:MAG: UUP1 family membrane protein [Gammaproteobacteria bacterium]|jgi:hypothetical protein